MVRLLLQITAAACLVYLPQSQPLDHQVLALSDAGSLLQAVTAAEQSRPKSENHDKEARKLGAKKTKVAKAAKSEKTNSKEAKRKAKQRASKLVRKNVMMLLEKAGIPDVLASMFSGFIHDSLMDLRSTSRGRQEFIDYIAEEIGNMTQEEVNLKSLLMAVREAGEHSHLEKPIQEFINDVEELLMPNNSTEAPTPGQMFQVVAKGFENLGMPAEMSNFLKELAATFDGDAMQDPMKMFGMMSGLYRKMGMPEEVIGVLDEFSSLFAGIVADANNSTEMAPEKILDVLSAMMKKLGMPPAMQEFCSDLGKFMANNTEPSPEMMMGFMTKAMTAMGAPPEMAAGVGELMKVVTGDGMQSPDAFNLTKVISDIQGVDMGKMLTGMAKVSQTGFTKLQASPASAALITSALARIATEFKDMIEDEEPVTWKALTGEVLAPSLLHMILAEGRQLVQAKHKLLEN